MFLGTGSLLCKVIVKNIEFVMFFVLLRIIDKIGLIGRIDLSKGSRGVGSEGSSSISYRSYLNPGPLESSTP